MERLTRHTTFSFTLEPTALQAQGLFRHVGAARFAFNQGLRLVKDRLAARDVAKEKGDNSTIKVPWSGFDLINEFNAWKVSPDAGIDDAGRKGLPWRGEVCQQVFEEAAVDLGRALAAFSQGRRADRRGRAPGFPRFKKRSSARRSFRIRNNGAGKIRIGDRTARTIRLPKLGPIAVCECTRDLRRLLRKGRAKILFATVSHRGDGKWRVSLNVEADELHVARKHAPGITTPAVGIDRGLATFAVAADADGSEIARIDAPRPLREGIRVVRRRSKALSRKKLDSRNRARARARLSKTHARISFVRRDFVHRESSRLAKTHGRLVIEDLCTVGMMKTRLARSVADSAWALFGTLLTYKARWYGGTLTLADRFYPSTRRCSACGHLGDKLEMSERTFHCAVCGFEADRDTNAAVNLATYPHLVASGLWPHVAAKRAETINAGGERSSGARPMVVRETALDEAGRASRPTPEKGGADETVNTL